MSICGIIYSMTAPLRRLRHWRGKGVHSPFMYGVVRNVFLPKQISGPERGLYEESRKRGISRKDAVALQNLYGYCGVDNFMFIDGGGTPLISGRNICIVDSLDAAGAVTETASMLGGTGSVLVWLAGDRNRNKVAAAEKIYEKFHCVMAVRPSMVIMFFDNKLNKQKYII